MKLVGQVVRHPSFGVGVIVEERTAYVTVHFTAGHKEFSYPGAFSKYLEFTDKTLQAQTLNLLTYEEPEKPPFIPETGFLYLQGIGLHTEPDSPPLTGVPIRRAAGSRYRTPIEAAYSNLAFKCRYCDGTGPAGSLGFEGPCSPELIQHHLGGNRGSSCGDDTSLCSVWNEGQAAYSDLLRAAQSGELCAESSLLQKWEVRTGMGGRAVSGSGRVRGNPGGKLGILTTRLPDAAEKDRLIFGLFLIADDPAALKQGFVRADPDYRLSFTAEEAQEMPYWKYHANANQPDTPAWGSGLYRYIPDSEALRILMDTEELKRSAADGVPAADLLDEFCRRSRLSPGEAPAPSGPLARQFLPDK